MTTSAYGSLSLPCPVDPFVPHEHGMCLLDTILRVDTERLRAQVTPNRQDLFATDQGVPGWVGLEWMAQAVAAWAGVHEMAEGRPPLIGFLLGCRRYSCNLEFFAFDSPIRVDISQDFRSAEGLAAFQCTLLDSQENQLASATLNVYQPDTEAALVAMQKGTDS